MLKIGCHVGMSGPHYYLGSVMEALSYGANTFMFYTGAPQNSIRTPLDKLKIEEAKELLNKNQISLESLVVHAPYLINLGNLNPEKSKISFDLLVNEMNRTHSMGCKYLVLHPGASLEYDRYQSMDQIACLLNNAIQMQPHVMILLETMAGKGSEIGKTFQEIAYIIERINQKENIGVCLDTCHIHDGGYDLTKLDELINDFNQIIGLKYLKVCHINDSKNERNSHKDRHENIGFGKIGYDTLIQFIYHPLLEDKIFILETPYIKKDEKSKESFPPYKFEIESIVNKHFDVDMKEKVLSYYQK